MNGTVNSESLAEVIPPQGRGDMYQDVDSEEFSDFEADVHEEADIPALVKLNEEMKAMLSDEDVDEMMTYLKEDGMMAWINRYVTERKIPVLVLLAAMGAPILLNVQKEPNSDQNILHRLLKVTLTRILRRRSKLKHINTPEDVVELIKKSKNIVVLTGAGISVSCGIPDFRSSSGIYAQINENNNYELEDPQQMFDIDYFREKPSVFYSFASQIYPSNFVPSPCHRFIRLLEDRDILLRNYTQNIDTLETEVGVTRVLQCHGSFATATCIECKTKVNGSILKEDIFARRIPLCKNCNKPTPPTKGKSKSKKKDVWNPKQKDADDDMDIPTPPLPKGIMKPDIVFFGEPLNDEFDHCLFKDRDSVDLLLVIGTSLKAVSEILTHIPHSVPQVLINKTPVTHVNPDVVLLGDADRVIEYLCDKLAWTLPGVGSSNKTKMQARLPGIPTKPTKSYNHDHVWLFPGGEGGSWALRDPPAVKPASSFGPSRPESATSSIRKRLSNESLRPTLDRKDTDRSTKKSRLV
ncbi:NAD-dependent histone deacetylase SIR2 [Rhizoctonia solani AG-1 IB]|uniref:NAD-dependent histone deacetylase SIR2 n=1 Tax=Thanatephorus cucumeris (strain AG1-IB / isolate 7/3/14) TaxID=1108050 RepID=A0A0B7G0P2_THACB|nr:NAD-dependent histone deacetylase SIR2 [Rhizoctonia solani AG-1 IB]